MYFPKLKKDGCDYYNCSRIANTCTCIYMYVHVYTVEAVIIYKCLEMCANLLHLHNYILYVHVHVHVHVKLKEFGSP